MEDKDDGGATFQVYVRGGNTCCLRVTRDMTVEEFETLVARRACLEDWWSENKDGGQNLGMLTHGGKRLMGGCRLSNYNLQDGCTVHWNRANLFSQHEPVRQEDEFVNIGIG